MLYKKAAHIAGAIFLTTSLQTTFAGEYMLCLLTNKVALAGLLRDYTDKQVENGLCMVTKGAVLAIAAKNSVKEDICLQASKHMMTEFLRRFPNRSAKSVVGKC